MIFSRGKLRTPHLFYFGEETIEVVNECNYLGIVFNYNAKFNGAKPNLCHKGNMALFPLPKPVILYSSELWGDKKMWHIGKITT